MTEIHAEPRAIPNGKLGSFCLINGMLLLGLRGLELTRSLPGMPRFWYVHETLWWGLGLALTAFGAWNLWKISGDQPSDAWRPQRPGQRFQHLILYTRLGCHLCEEARQVLETHRAWLPEIVEVDIDHDPRLVEKFTTCVPVVSFDGKIRFRGKVSPSLLRRLIEGTVPIQP